MGWRDEQHTAIVVASGPSAGDAGLDAARDWPCIAVNDAWRLAPWAAVLYACDGEWWNVHHGELAGRFHGERWTQDKVAAERYGLRRVEGRHAVGLSPDVDAFIHYNSNSGAQALQLAYRLGARRLVLVGFDMGPRGGRMHFFGDHPKPLRNQSPYLVFEKNTRQLVRDLDGRGVEVWDCSPARKVGARHHGSLFEALR